MGGNSEIGFEFGPLVSDVDDEHADWQLLLRINTQFKIILGDEIFYSEEEFPVVEFASQCGGWLRNQNMDFCYNSMESEEEPLIAFTAIEGGFLVPYSPHQCLTPPRSVKRASVVSALTSFLEKLERAVLEECGIEIRRVL